MATEEASERDDLPERGQMSLMGHLGELRNRVIISAIAVSLGAIVVFTLFDPIVGALSGPYQDLTVSQEFPDGKSLIFTDPLEGFLVRLKVATYGGIVIALPILLWQLWRFITPGLYPKEKRYAVPFVLTSVVLFGLGAFVAWLTVPQALSFLLGVGGDNLEPLLTANKYLSLITLMMLAFGISFEFPLVLIFLMIAGVLSSQTLRKYRRYAIVGMAVFTAVITPSQDPYSFLFMMVPLYIFYESAIVVGRLMKK